MGITIIKQGIADTIQDKGRKGYRYLGMNTGGAMDLFAYSMANFLAGNFNDEAVIEMHFPAPVILFNQPALIALAGADFEPLINGEKIPLFHPILVNKDSILHFNRIHNGARVYLAVNGGFDIEPWFSSRSSNILAGPPGLLGRILHTSLSVLAEAGKKEFSVLPWQAVPESPPAFGNMIYVLPGHEWDDTLPGSREIFLNNEYMITHHSNRMGYRLKGEALNMVDQPELISTAVSVGTIQLLPDGQLIILMADHQTTGGYPRIAHVITAHHPLLAQCRAGESLRFRIVSQAEAEKIHQIRSQYLQQLKYACKLKHQEKFPPGS
jgi:antagonist of KipI